MGTVSDLLSLAGGKAKPEAFPPQPQSHEQPSVAPPPSPPSHSERATFADIGSRIGEDNEVLRNLLIDTSHQLIAFDDLKESFTRLIDPLNNVLTTLEQEKADNAAARGALAAMRSSHEILRGDYQQLERKTSELEDDNERLRQDLEHAVSNAREIEAERAKLAGEIAGGRTAMAAIVKQLGEETNTVRLLQEEKSRLIERAEGSENRAVSLEAEVAHVRERLSLLGSAKDALQASLDKTLGESSRMGRQLAETETALSDARARIQQMETALAVGDAERNKLAAACDEANERRQSEVYALGLKLEALRSHSDAAEKLLGNARQSLVARTEEMRLMEAKLLQTTVERTEAEKKVQEHAAIIDGWEQHAKTLEQNGSDLTERCRVLSETLTTSETWLVHAKDKIKSLSGQVEQLQADSAASRAKYEEDFVQLNATIEHERCERALAEGALETIRGDYARLQSQMAQERSIRRGNHQRRIIGASTDAR